MKKHINWVILALVIISIGSWAVLAQSQKDASKVTWEYTQTNTGTNLDNSVLNRLGNEGWELVSVTSGCTPDSGCTTVGFLKRRK